MRDPAPGPGPLETFYRPFVEEGSLWPEPTPAGERYEAETLRQGQRDWLARMLDEYRAMLDFTELLSLASRAFLPLESPAALVEVDKNTGSILSSKGLSDFPSPSNIDTFAFAAWGGDFYLFVRTYGMGESTSVYEVTESGTMTKVVDGLGLNVVGAGVSTCASTD